MGGGYSCADLHQIKTIGAPTPSGETKTTEEGETKTTEEGVVRVPEECSTLQEAVDSDSINVLLAEKGEM